MAARSRPARSAVQASPRVDHPPPAPKRLAPVLPADASPVDRAWAAVVAECPEGRRADEHRAGQHFVHVVPMRHPHDVRCVPGEPVPGYDGFYRPQGGPVDLHPAGTVFPTEAELRQGAKPPAPVYSRKSFTYVNAEMTGR